MKFVEFIKDTRREMLFSEYDYHRLLLESLACEKWIGSFRAPDMRFDNLLSNYAAQLKQAIKTKAADRCYIQNCTVYKNFVKDLCSKRIATSDVFVKLSSILVDGDYLSVACFDFPSQVERDLFIKAIGLEIDMNYQIRADKPNVLNFLVDSTKKCTATLSFSSTELRDMIFNQFEWQKKGGIPAIDYPYINLNFYPSYATPYTQINLPLPDCCQTCVREQELSKVFNNQIPKTIISIMKDYIGPTSPAEIAWSSPREMIKQRLEDYILHIQQQRSTKDPEVVDYAHGFFCIGAKNRSRSREVNCLLAQRLLNALRYDSTSLREAFSNLAGKRQEIVDSKRLLWGKWYINPGMNSQVLEQIIQDAKLYFDVDNGDLALQQVILR